MYAPWNRKTAPPVDSTLVKVCKNIVGLFPVCTSTHPEDPYESNSIAVVFALSTLTSVIALLLQMRVRLRAALRATGIGFVRLSSDWCKSRKRI